MVYSQTMANIVSFLLDSICDVILRMEDIRSVDAEITAVMVDELLAQLVPVFTVSAKSASGLNPYYYCFAFRSTAAQPSTRCARHPISARRRSYSA